MTEPESGATPPEKPVEKPVEKPPEAGSADKPAATEAASDKPASAEASAAAADKPAAAKPAVAAKPLAKPEGLAAAAGDKPAAKPAAHAVAAPPPSEPAKDLEPGVFGTFLKEHGIESARYANHSGDVECIEVAGKDLEAALKRLRNSPETMLNYLLTITGTEHPGHFESVYHLWSYSNLNQLVIKVKVPKEGLAEGQLPVVPSIANMWGAANWHERETFDLVGIRYSGHPYLRRILNPWDWDGHPLRRDYKQPVDALNDKNPDSMR